MDEMKRTFLFGSRSAQVYIGRVCSKGRWVEIKINLQKPRGCWLL